jgi:hypothetical protein
MAMRQVLSEGRLIEAFVYEGEDIAAEYPDGTCVQIPKNRVHTLVHKGILADGSPCYILLEKTPMTRLDIVLVEETKIPNTQNR